MIEIKINIKNKTFFNTNITIKNIIKKIQYYYLQNKKTTNQKIQTTS